MCFCNKGRSHEKNLKNSLGKKRLVCWSKQKYFYLNSNTFNRMFEVIK